MEAVGATPEEIVQIRNEDRAAQGVTPEHDRQALKAVRRAQHLLDPRSTVVKIPHGKTAPVTDFLHQAFGGPGFENLLVVSPVEVNFFGERRIVRWLARQFPQGWSGGALPQRGFWGHPLTSETAPRRFVSLLCDRIRDIAPTEEGTR